MKLKKAQQDYARDCFRDALLAIAAREDVCPHGGVHPTFLSEAKAIARSCVEMAASIRQTRQL